MKTINFSNLITALIAVESGGNDMAIGDGGRAIGPLQIHRAVVLDVNRIAGTHYTHDQMTNRVAASRVCEIYLDHYGRNLDDISRARVWNGGPRGHLRGSTRAYGLRVQRAIRDLENRTVKESFTVAGKTKRKTENETDYSE